jgi:hypothetical protein
MSNVKAQSSNEIQNPSFKSKDVLISGHLSLILRRRQTPPFRAEMKTPHSINPEQPPGFSLGEVEGLIWHLGFGI